MTKNELSARVARLLTKAGGGDVDEHGSVIAEIALMEEKQRTATKEDIELLREDMKMLASLMCEVHADMREAMAAVASSGK